MYHCAPPLPPLRSRHPGSMSRSGRGGEQHLRGLTKDGRIFDLTRTGPGNNGTEFAGACFSPDGQVLFVNLFGDGAPGSGMTCAIWGPWKRGPL